jgi:hypothetical protein
MAADIVLAEHRGQVWLVSGEQYIDDLLANTLPIDVSIEFVACESHSEIDELWERSFAPSSVSRTPWMIHPAIVDRIRCASTGHCVIFGQWSALLDDHARVAIEAAAEFSARTGDANVTLISYVAPDGPPLAADLAALRSGLIEVELTRLGIARSRIARASRAPSDGPGNGSEAQRIDIIIGTD